MSARLKKSGEMSADEKRALLTQMLQEQAVQKLPLSFSQQRLWFFDQLQPNSSLYNLPLALELSGVLDEVALQAALNAIGQRHETLRTNFVCQAGMPTQVIQ